MSLFTLTVSTHERVVEYVDGVITRVLGPGRHWIRWRATHVRLDVLERIVTTAAQEVLTADGVNVRVTAAVRWRIADPRAYVSTVADPAAVVYLAVQIALRDALVDVAADDLVRQARRLAGEPVTDAARAAARPVGVEVVDVVVKDVVLPLELRSAHAALVTTRTRGQAQLEAARAETAALRSLANGAKLLEDHPALARMRLVQALPPGSTVTVGLAEAD